MSSNTATASDGTPAPTVEPAYSLATSHSRYFFQNNGRPELALLALNPHIGISADGSDWETGIKVIAPPNIRANVETAVAGAITSLSDADGVCTYNALHADITVNADGIPLMRAAEDCTIKVKEALMNPSWDKTVVLGAFEEWTTAANDLVDHVWKKVNPGTSFLSNDRFSLGEVWNHDPEHQDMRPLSNFGSHFAFLSSEQSRNIEDPPYMVFTARNSQQHRRVRAHCLPQTTFDVAWTPALGILAYRDQKKGGEIELKTAGTACGSVRQHGDVAKSELYPTQGKLGSSAKDKVEQVSEAIQSGFKKSCIASHMGTAALSDGQGSGFDQFRKRLHGAYQSIVNKAVNGGIKSNVTSKDSTLFKINRTVGEGLGKLNVVKPGSHDE